VRIFVTFQDVSEGKESVVMSTLSITGISLSSQIMEGCIDSEGTFDTVGVMEGCIDGSSEGTFDTVGVMVGGIEMEGSIDSCLDGTVDGLDDG